MSVIFDINHESGDTTGYSAITNPDGDEFNVIQAAALGGTHYGLAVTVDDTDNVYGEKYLSSPNTSGVWRLRFYFDPNSITWPNSATASIVMLQAGDPDWEVVLVFVFGKNGSGDYVVQSRTQLDSTGYDDSGLQIISDAPHCLEAKVTSGAGTGTHELWVDGVSVYSDTALDNDTAAASVLYTYMGVLNNAPVGASGVLHLDELIVNDTGDLIGASQSSPIRSASPFDDYTRNWRVL